MASKKSKGMFRMRRYENRGYSMGFWALILSTVLYLIETVDLALIKKNYALALIFFCYAVANVGYVWLGYTDRGSL